MKQLFYKTLNWLLPITGTNSRLLINRKKFRLKYSRRTKNHWMGRFGGCWQWKLGFMATSKYPTIIISLLIIELRVELFERRPIISKPVESTPTVIIPDGFPF